MKDSTKIHGIKQNPNEGIQAFMDRFKDKSSHIKGVPPILRIYGFMNGHGHLKLAKKLNNKTPKTIDEMWERVKALIRGEMTIGTAYAIKIPYGDEGMKKMTYSSGKSRSRNRNNQRGYERSMGIGAPYAKRDGFTPLIKTPKEILAMDL